MKQLKWLGSSRGSTIAVVVDGRCASYQGSTRTKGILGKSTNNHLHRHLSHPHTYPLHWHTDSY